MSEVSTELIKEAVYKLCFEANTCLDERVYSKILTAYNNTQNKILKTILQNAKIAYEKRMPLCQDTGQVIVFVELGQDVKLTGVYLEDAINSAVSSCYVDNFFRKSVVANAIFDRTNTKDNTPAIIYTKIIKGDSIKLKVLIKGAGSENKSKLEMLLPTSNEEEVISVCANMILMAGENSCPPMFIGVGVGATAEKASLMSKEALVTNSFCEKEKELANKIKDLVNAKSPKKYDGNFVLDVKLLSSSTHIACMPIAITINCHSDRTSSCEIKDNNIFYEHKVPNFVEVEEEAIEKEIFSDDIDAIKSLKKDEEILLTGEIYVARDMAHKKIKELMDKGEKLPFDIKDKIIFYAGPCPNKPSEIIGSIGPTTASRMDKYAVEFYNKGLLATIAKGDRSIEVENAIKKNGAKYFTVTGGVAALLADKVKKSEIIAFEELGAEAIYKLYVEKLPVKIELS